MSATVVERTTASSHFLINEHIWQEGLSHSGALRLAKSEGTLTLPERC